MRDAFATCLIFLGATVAMAEIRVEQRAGDVFEASQPFSWPESTARNSGLDPSKLEAAAELAGASRSDSLLVLRHGKLVLERYWNGKTADDVQQTYSGTKSFFVLLVGRALQQGYLRDLDQQVREIVPEMPAELAQLTFRNVLAMESGMLSDLTLEQKGSRAGKTQLEVALERSIVAEPFSLYHYNNTAYRLLFVALERASGKTLEELTADEIFAPLGMDCAYWMRLYAVDDGGLDRHTGYQSIRLTPRDYAKSAQIVVDGGMWNGERFLPRAFVEAAIQAPRPEVNPSFGLFWHLNAGSFYRDYAEPRRLERKLVPGAPDDTFLMIGSQGQLVVGIPSLELVVVRTGPDPGSSPYGEDNFFARLVRVIVEAAE